MHAHQLANNQPSRVFPRRVRQTRASDVVGKRSQALVSGAAE